MIADNLRNILATLKPGVRLVAVSKFHPVSALEEAYSAGQRVFGESHVQEMVAKQQAMPEDIQWHFIGHLQTNKVKYIAPFVSMIHAVDSVKLLLEIDKHAARCGRVIDCLLQVHIAAEETKFGFTPDELRSMLRESSLSQLSHIRIRGLMCMATNTDDQQQIATEFCAVHDLFNEVKAEHFQGDAAFSELSMGMSSDYLIAQQHGSTMVRVGSLIFGERVYGTMSQ